MKLIRAALSVSAITLFLVANCFGQEPQETDTIPPNMVLMGDMLVESRAAVSSLGALKLNAELWEDGIIPVSFARGTSRKNKAFFMDACAIWSRAANVRCIEGSYKGRVLHVLHVKNLGCFSLYGMGLNHYVMRRIMNLEEGCWYKSTILHELGHAFGLIHEHQRLDRDGFVKIHSENATKSFFGLNIDVNYGGIGATPYTPYDFLSIMHYDRKAFSKNGKNTIDPLPQYVEFLDVMGRVSTISEGDAKTMSALYGTPGEPMPRTRRRGH